MSEELDDEPAMAEHWRAYHELEAEGCFPKWVIYRPPVKSYDGRLWVARMWISLPVEEPTDQACTGLTLDAVRAKLPEGLVFRAAHPDDDPSIAEVWI
jgi:hypothetical protein